MRSHRIKKFVNFDQNRYVGFFLRHTAQNVENWNKFWLILGGNIELDSMTTLRHFTPSCHSRIRCYKITKVNIKQ